MSGMFPDAAYLVLSSRLVPDLDGGYTVATLARARQMAARGADVQVLTVDPADAAAHAAHREEFVRRGMLPADVPMRNLFDEAASSGGGAADWLLVAAADAAARGVSTSNVAAPDAAQRAAEERVLTDAEGRPFVALPVISGDPDWHLTRAAVEVFGADGGRVGSLAGFGALYRAWLSRLVDSLSGPVVVVCESRQLGELLAGWAHPRVRIVHMIHTMHLEAPYTPDAPVNALWSRWFGLSERFDAVVWPTRSQRDAVVERFGDRARNLVAPNGVAPDGVAQDGRAQDGPAQDGLAQDGLAQGGLAQDGPAQDRVVEGGLAQDGLAQDGQVQAGAAGVTPERVSSAAHERGGGRSAVRQPGLVVSVSRLAAGKRLDHSIRAFLAADVPGAVFEIWGDGPERARLATLIEESGAGGRVFLRGSTTDAAGVLARASLFVTSTAFEGQGLSIVEALAVGTPVVSYDVRFGPGDILAGGGGLLVPDGDEVALAGALRMLLSDGEARSRLAREARASAAAWSDDAAMAALADVMAVALRSPARR